MEFLRERLRILAAAFEDRSLRRLALAVGAFAFVETATWIAILIYAFQRGGVVEAGLVGALLLLPAALLAPLAAVTGDRIRRDLALGVGYLVLGLGLAAGAVAIASDVHRFWAYAAMGIVCVTATIARPTSRALLTELRRGPAGLATANAAVGLLETLGELSGPLGAALLLQVGTTATVLGVGAVLALVCLLLVANLERADPGGRAVPVESSPSLRRSLLEGFGHLRRDRGVRLLLFADVGPWLAMGAMEVLLVAAAVELLGREEHVAGVLQAAFGIGSLVGAGSAVALSGGRRLGGALCLGALGMGLPIVGLAATSALPVALVLLFASGWGHTFGCVASVTLIQRSSPNRILARVLGVQEGVQTACLGVGALLAAGLPSVLGIPLTLVVVGSGAPAVLILAWRRLDRVEHADRRLPAALLPVA